jgi:mannose-1-phosphate guanylyltransferase
MHLGSLRKRAPARRAAGAHIKGDGLVDATAKIGAGCLIGPNVVIGPGCVVGDGARISRATLLAGVAVGAHACVTNCIVGWNSSIGKWARVEGGAVFGEDVQLADEVAVNGALILPHKGIKDNLVTPGQIVM